MLVMTFSILATLGLLSFQRYVIRRTDSTAIKADALHYRTDLLVNGSVILALWLSVRGTAFTQKRRFSTAASMSPAITLATARECCANRYSG